MSRVAAEDTPLGDDQNLDESEQRALKYGRWCTTQPEEDDLMITGIAGALPDSRNLHQFRDNLYNKVDMVTEDDRRWVNIHPEIPKRAGKLFDIEKFDAGYFGVHHRQATAMDPLVRLVLEKAVEAVMDAGVNPKELEGSNTGVFVGSSFSESEKTWYYDNFETQMYAWTGCQRSMISHRVSYHLKLKGPSFNVDTACSSSMYAIEHAYKALKNGTCDSAIAIGVNLNLHPFVTLQFARLGVLSKTGACKVFDVNSDGYVRSEAVGAIFLQKRKVSRRTYGQLIHAKTNQDGFKPQGITFPSTIMQGALFREFYRECAVDPSSLSYMEAHGTATVVGDPEEVNAINKVFCQDRKEPFLVGSVKSNVGHGEPSSGFASLAKVVIAMENNLIPANLHYTAPRPGVTALEEGRVKVVVENTPFQDDRGLVGINSFGFGGSNGHILVQWNTKKKTNHGMPRDKLPRLVCVSGRVPESISEVLNDLKYRKLDAEYVRLYHDLFKDDFPGHYYRGYTIVSRSSGELARSSSFFAKKNVHLGFGELPWSKIANELYELPLFVGYIQRIHDILMKKGVNITDILMNNGNNKPVNTAFNQILGSAAVQIAIADVLKVLGLKPDGLIKRGFGQLLCYYCDESLTLEQVLNCALTVATVMDQSADVEIQQNGQQHQNGNITGDKQNGNYKNLRNLAKQVIDHNEVKFTFESVKNFKIVKPKLIKALEKVMTKTHLEPFVDSLAEPRLVQVNHDDVVLSIGRIPNLKNAIIFDGVEEHSTVALLKTLGELYEQGQNFALDQLYPKVEYPVSRGTPMISPLIKWNHENDWHVTKFKQQSTLKKGELLIKVAPADDDWSYVMGHVIDGRNLFPATGYLDLVWKALAMKSGQIQTQMRLVFEDCRFHRATNVAKDRTVELTVIIQSGSGNFEVVEGETAIVTGKVYTTGDLNERQLNLPKVSGQPDELPLLSKDVYKELRLRGYNYTGSFRAVTECSSTVGFGKIHWDNNWVTLMDNMLQLEILQLDTRLLYVPTCIKYLSIDAGKHLEYIESLGEEADLPVYLNKESRVMQCGGIEIRGLKASSIAKRKQMEEPVLEKYVFVPNHAELQLTQAVRTNMQIILENTPGVKMKAVELVDEATRNKEPLAPLVYQAIADMPLIAPEIKVFSKESLELPNIAVDDKKLTTESDCNLVIGTDLLQRTLILAQALEAIKSNGYLLSRESVDFDLSSLKDFEVLTTYAMKNELLVLFRKPTPKVDEIAIQITSDLAWLQPLQDAIKNRRNVIIYAENEPLSGILGLINCIRREPDGSSVRCVLTFDNAPKFNPADPFYEKQLNKNFAVNVFKNSEWGTYRHLRLENTQTVEREHCYVNTLARGDLSSMRWIEGPLTSSTKLKAGEELVTIYYSAMNFRDVMTASGRINVDSVMMDRLKQDCIQGFEFSGRTQSGRRVMGMISHGALATMIKPDTNMLWTVPSSWTLEEAATVPVVYGTLIYAMYMRTQIKAGDSILIHSGSGGVGQAAIYLALHQGCTVFTTVGTQEKREYLKKKFPKLNEKNIGNSRDTSFEQMIHARTGGRGVDFIINSLAEEKLQASVRCLAKGGRFLEIGKFDMQSDNALQLIFFEKEASFHGIMLDQIFYSGDHCKTELGKIMNKLIDNGAIQPLERTIFLENEIEPAHRYMMSGKHMGKVLVKLCQEEAKEIHVPPRRTIKGIPKYHCDPEKVYLITGGLGGFGLELADWLVLRGARKLVLTSRSGLKTGYQAYRIKLWRSYGVLVSVSTADITKKSGCEELIREALKLGDLAAIFNLAVVLKDALLENQSVESFEVSFGPKADATLYLDEITRKLCPSLRDFVVFSSVSCGRGNAGQSNYGMSNSVMERICERRREQGFSALAIEWGAVGDVGIVADMQEEHTELEIGGTLQQKISSCIEVLDVLLVQDNAVVASMVVAKKHGGGLSSNLVEVVAQILGIKDMKTVSLQSTLSELGMDSMTAVEIKQTLEREFQVFLTPQDIRTLTFARLHEIHEELGSDSSGAGKGDKPVQGFEMLIRNLIDEGRSQDVKVKMETCAQPGNAKRPHVIMFPGIEGTAKTLQPLANNLLVDATSLQYCCDKMEDTVEGIADSLLPTVEGMLSKSDPFHIIAYSFGAVLATEVVSKLEKKGYTGKMICIDGAPEMLVQLLKTQLDIATEAEFQTTFLCHVAAFNIPLETIVKNKERIFKCANFEERLQVCVDINPKDSKYSVDHLVEITTALYKRIHALTLYKTALKIKSPIELFKPSSLSIPDLPDDYKLSDIAVLPVDTKVFQGNHATMLENIELAQRINEWAGAVVSEK